MSENVNKLQEICMRLDHLDAAGDWLARSLVHVDSSASHTGTLVTVLAEDIRQRLLDLVSDLEKEIYLINRANGR